MKAVAITEFGGRDKLKVTDLAPPPLGDDDVLINIKAAGVNPVDWKIREGLLEGRLPHEFPLIPGWDAAGTVAKTGKNVSDFKEGDKVYAYCRTEVVQYGTYAECISVPAENVARMPATMSFAEAASVPLAALTAYQALFSAAGLQHGETVLVHAAAGGVGTFAVQLAKNVGATVYGTASAGNHDYLRDLGVDDPIDYKEQDFRDAISRQDPEGGVDVVLDCIGGDTLIRSTDVLRDGGRLVSLLEPDEIENLKNKGIDAHYVFVEPSREQLTEIAGLIDAKKVRTFISTQLDLEDAAKAHELSESGHVRGKIVLKV